MNDIEFDAFLESVIKEKGREYIEYTEELDKPHVFSRSFEWKMNRMIKKQNRYSFYPTTRLPLRKTVLIAVIMILMMTIMVVTVSAFREAIWSFIMSIFDTHTHVTVEADENAPEEILKIYEIKELPVGYYLEELNDLVYTIKTVYSNGKDRLTLRQSVKKEYKANVNTENNEALPVYVGDYAGFSIEYEGFSFLEWETEDYVFSLTGSFGKDELITIAETIQ